MMKKSIPNLTIDKICKLFYTAYQVQESCSEQGAVISIQTVIAACKRKAKKPYGPQLDAKLIGKSRRAIWIIEKKSAEVWIQYQIEKRKKIEKSA